jgi:hypothetical protein
MADILTDVIGSFVRRFKDMGDTSHAEVIDVILDTASGAGASIGTTIDAAASSTVAEDTTARTGIGLWKGAKNILILINSVLGVSTGAAVITDTTGTIQQYLRGIVKLLAAYITVKVDQTTPGTTNRVQAGATKILSGTFTRPNDTTAYAANDGVTNATSSPSPITFANAVQAAGLGAVLRTAIMRKSTTTVANASFRLYLFDTTPGTVPNDNAAYSIPIVDVANLIGTIDFSLSAGSDCAWGVGTLLPDVQPFVVASGTSIFGILQALAAYAPGALEVFTIELGDFWD